MENKDTIIFDKQKVIDVIQGKLNLSQLNSNLLELDLEFKEWNIIYDNKNKSIFSLLFFNTKYCYGFDFQGKWFKVDSLRSYFDNFLSKDFTRVNYSIDNQLKFKNGKKLNEIYNLFEERFLNEARKRHIFKLSPTDEISLIGNEQKSFHPIEKTFMHFESYYGITIELNFHSDDVNIYFYSSGSKPSDKAPFYQDGNWLRIKKLETTLEVK